jgi:2-amino-4-hydroxy-6-hydroxymethyldihydropteridine diphosphokinase
MSANFYLCLGGNQGDKAQLFSDAIAEIENRVGELVEASSIYETEAWGFESDELFWNQVVVVRSSAEPHLVLKTVLEIEKDLGRVRKGKGYASRPMDIDILFIDDEQINTTDLIVPHPLLQERRFVLEPLAEIAATKVHPVLKKEITILLQECADSCKVVKKTTETK